MLDEPVRLSDTGGRGWCPLSLIFAPPRVHASTLCTPARSLLESTLGETPFRVKTITQGVVVVGTRELVKLGAQSASITLAGASGEWPRRAAALPSWL